MGYKGSSLRVCKVALNFNTPLLCIFYSIVTPEMCPQAGPASLLLTVVVIMIVA